MFEEKRLRFVKIEHQQKEKKKKQITGRKLPICTSILSTIDTRIIMDDMEMISDDAMKVSREKFYTYCQLTSESLILLY